MASKRQKKAIEFCESVLDVTFDGNINSYQDINAFLGKYLDLAKKKQAEFEDSDEYRQLEELKCDYETYAFNKLIE
jgi:hypothetical protein